MTPKRTIEGCFDRTPETPEESAIREEGQRLRNAFPRIDFDHPGAWNAPTPSPHDAEGVVHEQSKMRGSPSPCTQTVQHSHGWQTDHQKSFESRFMTKIECKVPNLSWCLNMISMFVAYKLQVVSLVCKLMPPDLFVAIISSNCSTFFV